jgi:hypothetical protein
MSDTLMMDRAEENTEEPEDSSSPEESQSPSFWSMPLGEFLFMLTLSSLSVLIDAFVLRYLWNQALRLQFPGLPVLNFLSSASLMLMLALSRLDFSFPARPHSFEHAAKIFQRLVLVPLVVLLSGWLLVQVMAP